MSKDRYVICWKGKRRDGTECEGCGPFAHAESDARYLASSIEALTGVPHFVYKEGE